MHRRSFFRSRLCRRAFLGRSLTITAGLWVGNPAVAAMIKNQADRVLAFHNLHTNENIECRYWSNGSYDQAALDDIAFVLRDHRTNDVKAMNLELLDLLTLIRRKLGTNDPYHVISGYRSPETNAKLHAKSKGVSKWSLHMYGKAIDVRMPNVPLPRLRRTGIEIQAGGVGYYAKSEFVHFDVGRPRSW